MCGARPGVGPFGTATLSRNSAALGRASPTQSAHCAMAVGVRSASKNRASSLLAVVDSLEASTIRCFIIHF